MALVVGYHLAPSTVPGGFLGVDIFFVLSGFLITSLAITEVRAAGGVRRRRVLRATDPAPPAGRCWCSCSPARSTPQVWAGPEELERLRDHSLWTLGYLANWRFIADGTTYTDALFGQSPLRHTWSLAIEEQFYILFPLLIVGLGRLVPGGPRRSAARSRSWRSWARSPAPRGWRCSGATAPIRPAATSAPTRGRTRCWWACCSASCWSAGRCERAAWPGPSPPPRCSAPLGLAAAALLSHEDSSALQHGGFLFVARRHGGGHRRQRARPPLQWFFTRRALVGLGLISYGVYLWHWPVIIVLDEPRTGLDGIALDAVRLAVTLAAALASYWLVELPVRRAGCAPLARAVPWRSSAAGLGTAAVVVLVATVVPSTTAPPPRTGSWIDPEVAAAFDLPKGVVMFGDSVARMHRRRRRRLRGVEPGAVVVRSRPRAALEPRPDLLLLPPRPDRVAGREPQRLSTPVRWVARRALRRPASRRLRRRARCPRQRRRPPGIDGERVELGSPRHQELLSTFLDELRAVARAARSRASP